MPVSSLPAEGEWIEMQTDIIVTTPPQTSLPAEGEWIEIVHAGYRIRSGSSLPAEGERIEMRSRYRTSILTGVSPSRGRED